MKSKLSKWIFRVRFRLAHWIAPVEIVRYDPPTPPRFDETYREFALDKVSRLVWFHDPISTDIREDHLFYCLSLAVQNLGLSLTNHYHRGPGYLLETIAEISVRWLAMRYLRGEEEHRNDVYYIFPPEWREDSHWGSYIYTPYDPEGFLVRE